MTNLRKLIKLESSIHLPIPIIELRFILLIAVSFFLFCSATTGTNLRDIKTFDLQNALLYPFGISVLNTTARTLLFLEAIAMSMLISMSMAGDLNSGFAETMLSYPISRKELLTSKAILYLAILVATNIIAISLGILFSPFTYPSWVIGLYLIIAVAKSFFIISSALLASITFKKPIPSAMVLTFFWFGLSIFGSAIPTPSKYLFLPEDLIMTKIAWTDTVFGLVGIFVLSIVMFLTAVQTFRKLPIMREQT